MAMKNRKPRNLFTLNFTQIRFKGWKLIPLFKNKIYKNKKFYMFYIIKFYMFVVFE